MKLLGIETNRNAGRDMNERGVFKKNEYAIFCTRFRVSFDKLLLDCELFVATTGIEWDDDL